MFPEGSEYSLVAEDSPTIGTTVTVDFSGHVELTSRGRRESRLLLAVDSARIASLAIETDVGAVSEWSEHGSAIRLGTETTQMAVTATLSGSEQALARVRVPAGETR